MGTEAIWIPAVAALVSSGAQIVQARNLRKKSDRIALDTLRSNDVRQKEANARTAQLIDETSASNNKAERSSLLSGFLGQLQKARPAAQAGLAPGVGGDYARDAAAAALGIDQKGQEFADLASRLDSPRYQRLREGRMRADAGVDARLTEMKQRDSDRLMQNRLRGVQANPWLQALAQVAGGVAGSYAGAAGGGAAEIPEWARVQREAIGWGG